MKKVGIWIALVLCLALCLISVSCKDKKPETDGTSGSANGATTTVPSTDSEPAHEHKYTIKLTVAPTETETGTAVAKCECGDEKTETVAKLTDATVWSVKETVAPTHTADGKKTYTSEKYGDVEVVLPKTTEHTYTWTLTTQPTETEDGEAKGVCACGDETTEPVAKLTDTTVWSVKETVDPTHTADGKKTYTSEKYGDVEVVLPKTTEHTYTWTFTTKPTETEDGEAKGVCACGDEKTETVAKLTDTTVWTVTTTAPTHAAAGETVYTSVYGTIRVELPQIEHHFINWTVIEGQEPTEDHGGKAKAKCSGCDAESTKNLPALSDTAFWTKNVVKEAAHGETGLIRYASAYLNIDVTIPALNHEWSDWTIDTNPTMTEAGHATRSCECGTVEDATVPALSDTDFWDVGATEPADYNHGTRTTYTGAFGTVTVEADDRLKPAYADKTYIGIGLTRESEKENGMNSPYWWPPQLTVGADGTGTGEGFPFQGDVRIELVDVATGKIQFSITHNGETTDYEGYVDLATGIIVRARLATKADTDPFADVILMTPFEADGTKGTVKVSAWTYDDGKNAMAVEYTFGETVYRVFIADGKVTFGVTFTDLDGTAVDADKCYNHSSVIVKNANGDQIAAFGYDGTRMRVLDGTQGTYTIDGKTFVLSGYGTLTYRDGDTTQSGTYTKAAEGAGYGFDVILVDASGTKTAYGHLTLSEAGNTFVKPTVRISFTGDSVSADAIDANVSVPTKLPTPATAPEGMKFVGWADADGNLVADPYIPETDVTLTAVWKQKLTVKITGLADADQDAYGTIYPPVGALLGSILPKYDNTTIDWKNNRKFENWYYDVNGNGVVDDDDTVLDDTMELDESLLGQTICIIAVWKSIPAYSGTFNGTEVYYETGGNSNLWNLTISEDGAVSGKLTGTVVSYDPETGLLVIKSGNSNLNLYYNAEAGILTKPWSGNDLGPDFCILSRELSSTDYKMAAHYGVKCVNPVTGTGSQSQYAQFVVMKTRLGDSTVVMVYNNRIYHNVTITTAYGDAVSVDQIVNQSTLVVKAADGTVLFAVKSDNATFKGSTTSALDAYYGAYTSGDDTVRFDGAGHVKWTNGEIGTYEWVEDHFDIFVKVDDALTYYKMTVTADKAYTVTKPMTTITVVVPDGMPAIAAKDYNSNVTATLPNAAVEGYVFNGYYFDAAFTDKVPDDYKPTGESVTLYAKYSNPAVLTINRNNDTEQETVTYSVGDIATVENPKRAGYRFLGWYTTATFDEGSEWTGNGAAITADVTIYAKWGEAVKAAGEYKTSYETYSETNSYTKLQTITVDEDGNITTSDGYTGVIGDVVCGTVTLKNGTATRVYFYVESLGLFVRADNAYSPDMGNDGWFYFKGEISGFTAYGVKIAGKSTYARILSFKLGEETHFVFVEGNDVYADVTVTDAFGNALTVANIKSSKTLTVKDSAGTVLFSVAATGTSFSNGSSTVNLDGLQGIYTVGDKTVELDGAGNIKYDGKTGTYTKVADGDSYDVYLNSRKEYLTMTLDTAAKTAVMTKPMASISFDTAGGNAIDAVSVNIKVAYTLPTPVRDGYKFRGWYIAGAEETLYKSTYTPATTDAVTLIAKWDAEYTLKVVYGNGMDDVTLTYGEGDTTAPVVPGLTNGKVFDHWELADGTVYTAGPITANTEIKCIWKDAHPMTGSFAGTEVRGTGNSTIYGGSYANKLTIDANGKMTGDKSAVEVEYDATTGFFKAWFDATKAKYYYGYYDATTGLTVLACYTTQATDVPTFGDDFYVFFKDGSSVKATGCNIEKGTIKVLELTGTVGGESITKNVFVMNGKVWYGVAYTTSAGTTVKASSIYSNDSLTVTAADGTVIALFAKLSGAFVPLDGTQGTWTGVLGEIVSNGAGTVTVGEVKCAYTLIADGKIAFNYAGRYYVAQLADTGYTLVLDGYQGDYTLPDGTTVYTLDGYGKVTQNGTEIGTYTVSGANLTVNLTDGASTSYGIDTTEHKLLGKSVFAGYIFTGNYTDKTSDRENHDLRMVFDDSSEIKGTIYVDYGTTYYFNFELVSFEDNVLVVKITSAVTSSAVDKTVTLTLSGKTLTVTATTVGDSIYSFANNGSMTCADFPG